MMNERHTSPITFGYEKEEGKGTSNAVGTHGLANVNFGSTIPNSECGKYTCDNTYMGMSYPGTDYCRSMQMKTEADIQLYKAYYKGEIETNNYFRRLDAEFNRKRAYLDYKEEITDAPILICRISNQRLATMKMISGEHRIGHIVVEKPGLHFRRVIPYGKDEAPSIMEISWEGCEEPLYLIGDNISPHGMEKTLRGHIRIMSSRRNRSVIIEALFEFLFLESRTNAVQLHRFIGFNRDNDGNFYFVPRGTKLTIQEVMANG